MRIFLWVLFVGACAVSDGQTRRQKPPKPFVADATGITLAPPSNGPGAVGSPVNLLSPDRYEFYTFDESGELVKRLMTLEEIQAIVAAGEETEGLVTFPNENQPTIAFNFSQPPFTKVHSVVTNVQNVLKAQMEAHKNNPQVRPTLDTPDVSDSWSLILPSIFGNTGIDIVPDKSSGTFTTPETETIDFIRPDTEDNSLGKEGQASISSSTKGELEAEEKRVPVTEALPPIKESVKEIPTTTTTSTTTTTTTTTTPRPTISTTPKTTTTAKPTTTTAKPTTTTKQTTPSTTTKRRITSTSSKPFSTKKFTISITTSPKKVVTTSSTPLTLSTTTPRPRFSNRPQTTNQLLEKLSSITKSEGKATSKIPLTTTVQPNLLSTKESIAILNDKINTLTKVSYSPDHIPETSTIRYEKISTFLPISTAAYVTKKPITTSPSHAFASTTKRSITSTTKLSSLLPPSTHKFNVQPPITTYKPIILSTVSSKITEKEKLNTTTMTTQSVSPSTTVSSTEFMSAEITEPSTSKDKPEEIQNTHIKNQENLFPMFDVALSISQIASDLGNNNNYQPLPTSSNLIDTTINAEAESKESVEMDIPSDLKNNSKTDPNSIDEPPNSFIKISTLDPHSNNILNKVEKENEIKPNITDSLVESKQPVIFSTTEVLPTTIMDIGLSDSMDDLLSQIVNEAPSILTDSSKVTTTTEKILQNSITTVPSTKDTNNNKEDVKITPDHSIFKLENLTESISKNDEIVNMKESKPQNKNKDVETRKTNAHSNNQGIDEDLMKTNSTYSNSIIYDFKNSTLASSDDDNKDKLIESNTTLKTVNVVATEPIFSTTSPTPTISKKTTSQITIHKQESSVTNKINKESEKNKGPVSPKIDDFKKKIQKVNIDDKEFARERNNSWKLISTVSPPKPTDLIKDKFKAETSSEGSDKDIILEFSKENQGLEVTTKDLNEDVALFTELCNELAFRYWNTIVENIDKKRSFVLSPYSITSMLGMMFMGARGATSGEMNEILKLDDMVTFNPHFTMKNISDSIDASPEAGVVVSTFVRELYSDRNKGKILTFYKERAQHFYNGHVEEVNFKLISDVIRRRTNLLVKRYSWGRIAEYMKSNTITMQPPLAAFSSNIFQTDCSSSSVEGRDGEMYFVVSPNVRQRRLVPVPAVVYRKGFLAGYDPTLDATAAALGSTNSIVSTIFLMPGQQGNVVHADDLEALEKRLLNSEPSTPTWSRLLRTLLPRVGLELQIPRFSHKSIFNVSSSLKKMGLKDLFDEKHADLGGLNGPSNDLYLSDMIQSTWFVTCGEGAIGEQHHIEEYPETLELTRRRRTSRWNGWDEPRDYQRAFHDPHDVGEAMHLPLHLRPRQARLPARNAQPARLKFDRPFLYFVRHNPSGMILYVGRYNPRLLP